MINLIPLSYLNEACFLSLNVDNKKYQMVLKLAQDDLKNILGPEFYAEIESQYENDSLTNDNDSLYEGFVKDFLAWATYYKYLKFANVDSTPTGLREFSDENSTVVADVKMYALEKNILQLVNKYKGDMINFLEIEKEKDSTKYPLFMGCKKQDFSFAISVVDKKSNSLIKVNKAIITNE